MSNLCTYPRLNHCLDQTAASFGWTFEAALVRLCAMQKYGKIEE